MMHWENTGVDRIPVDILETVRIPVDILETAKKYVFYMDVPGLSKSHIQVLAFNHLDFVYFSLASP